MGFDFAESGNGMTYIGFNVNDVDDEYKRLKILDIVLSDKLIPAATTNYFIGLVRRNYKLRPERQASTFETTLYRRLV